MVDELPAAWMVGMWEHDTPEWDAFRAEHVGSSDVATVLGLTRKSAFTLWHEKRGLVPPEQPDAKLARKWRYGHHMEPFVANIFEEEHPDLALLATGSWQNRERAWQGCNPDRLVLRGGEFLCPLELKTFPSLADWQDGPPANYVAQLLWQADTLGAPGGYLAGYANLSGDYVEYWYDLNPFGAAATRNMVKEFLDADEPLIIDGSESTYYTLRRLNPSLKRGVEVEIPEDVAFCYLGARKNLKTAEDDARKWAGHLLAHMGTAQYATFNGQKIASRVAGRGEDPVPYLKEQ